MEIAEIKKTFKDRTFSAMAEAIKIESPDRIYSITFELKVLRIT